MIYISHPYTGNENYNLLNSIKLAAELTKKFPNKTFINPLSALQHNVKAGTSYGDCMKQCIELLSHCDAIIMAGEWENSKGCIDEYMYAVKHGKHIYRGIEDYNGEWG